MTAEVTPARRCSRAAPPIGQGAIAGPSKYPTPITSGALPLTFTPRQSLVLIVGNGGLAAKRVFSFLESSAFVILASTSPLDQLHPELQYRISTDAIQFTHLPNDDPATWDTLFRDHAISLATITDTLIGTHSRRSRASAEVIVSYARKYRVLVNVADHPNLCDFTFPSTHRWTTRNDGESSLQVTVSTSGNGCRLGARIRRDIVGKLGKDVGDAVENVGKLRRMAMAMDGPDGSLLPKSSAAENQEVVEGETDLSEEDIDTPLNTPVPQLSSSDPHHSALAPNAVVTKMANGDTAEEARLRRMRWVHQMSEYYSYEALAALTPEDMERALSTYAHPAQPSSREVTLPHHSLALASSTEGPPQKGRIYLIGSGPGHPGLITLAAHHLLRTATLILSDKLVPSEILALIPPSTSLYIAKKFPGNAEGAQNELMDMAIAGARKGEVVVRLKQGDPFVYGRGGEEVLFFRKEGYECTIVPGISSALAGPLMMGIPVTQRGVAESLVMCTGVGRAGRAVELPGYVKSRTLVVLMGVARISSIVEVLTSQEAKGRDGKAFPKHLPIGVIERASSPDQRVILSTLENIEKAVRSMEERPPGMMIIGWSALALEGEGRVDVLEHVSSPGEEREAVAGWLGGQEWKVREGLSREWEELLSVADK